MRDVLELVHFPVADKELQIPASDWTTDAKDRDSERYDEVIEYVSEYTSDSDIIVDFGGSSGSQLEELAGVRRYVFGLEPSEKIRAYAEKRHPKVKYVDAVESPNCAVYVRTLRNRFSDGEFRESIRAASVVVVISEVGKDMPFTEPDDLIAFMKKAGFELKALRLQRFIKLKEDEFTTEVSAVFLKDRGNG